MIDQIKSFKGNKDLLNSKCVSVTGSRKPSDLALEILGARLKYLIDNGYTIVSGNAKGSDTYAHKFALKHGGNTIFCLPEGINKFYIKSELKPFWNWNNVLVVSQFEPDTPWMVRNAFIRNDLIISFSEHVISVHPSLKGGTIATTKSALKKNKKVWLIDSNCEAQEVLLNSGAKLLTMN